MRRTTTTAVAVVLLAAVLFGTTGTSQALGPKTTTPLGVGAARLIVGGAALLLWLPFLGSRPMRAIRLWGTPVGFFGGACTALYQVCFFAAVLKTGVAVGTLVTIGSGPVFAGILAWLLLGERPDRHWLVATALCISGLGLLTLGGDGPSHVPVLGVVLALGSGLGYAAYTVAAKRLITGGETSATVMAATFGLGGLLLVPVLFSQPIAWLGRPSGVTLALYLGVVTTAIAYVLFGRGLAVLAAGPVTTLVLAEPLVATILGVAVLHEHLTAVALLGAGLVLAGLVMQSVASARRPSDLTAPRMQGQGL